MNQIVARVFTPWALMGLLGSIGVAAGPLDINAESPAAMWRSAIPDLISQQKRIWSFPAHLKEEWAPSLAIAGTTGALMAFDPKAAYFRKTDRFGSFNSALSGTHTAVATAVIPLTWYAVGWMRHDEEAQRTSILAGEAVADSELVSFVLKVATQRLRPSDIAPDGDFASTFFRAHSTHASFPSAHTIAAFSVATVFAERYHNDRWVPITAYSLATAVGFSRITLQSHFPSDVFAGAALGYVISRYAVLRW